jgi:hypothetical protein
MDWLEIVKLLVNVVIVPMIILLWKIYVSIHKLELLISNEYVKKSDFKDCQKLCEDRTVRLHEKIEKVCG